MKRGSTLFLKIALFIIGAPILAICIFWLPRIASYFGQLESHLLQYFIFLVGYGTAIPFFVALYQAYRLLSYIDKNQAFSDLFVRDLKNIKYCAMIISSFYVVASPLLYVLAEIDDAPGFIVIGIVIAFASFVIAVFAAVLQRLLQEAINIKSENDLTI